MDFSFSHRFFWHERVTACGAKSRFHASHPSLYTEGSRDSGLGLRSGKQQEHRACVAAWHVAGHVRDISGFLSLAKEKARASALVSNGKGPLSLLWLRFAGCFRWHWASRLRLLELRASAMPLPLLRKMPSSGPATKFLLYSEGFCHEEGAACIPPARTVWPGRVRKSDSVTWKEPQQAMYGRSARCQTSWHESLHSPERPMIESPTCERLCKTTLAAPAGCLAMPQTPATNYCGLMLSLRCNDALVSHARA